MNVRVCELCQMIGNNVVYYLGQVKYLGIKKMG